MICNYACTMNLRARQGEVWNKTWILEQAWVCQDHGEIEWRPIPKVQADGTPYVDRYAMERKC